MTEAEDREMRFRIFQAVVNHTGLGGETNMKGGDRALAISDAVWRWVTGEWGSKSDPRVIQE